MCVPSRQHALPSHCHVISFLGGKERRGCREERRGREDREVALGEEGVGKKFLVIEISSGDGLVQ